MNKHLTDIEIFEFSHQLLDDATQLVAFNDHLTTCEVCQLKVEKEKNRCKKLKRSVERLNTCKGKI